MSGALFEKVHKLVALTHQQLELVTVSGGEPLLHPQLESFIHKLSVYSRELTVVTNGLLLNQERLQSMVNAGVKKFRIGVDSISQLRSRPTSQFPRTDSIARKIDMIRELGVKLELNIVLTKFNSTELSLIFEFCRDRRISVKFFEELEVNRIGGCGKILDFVPKESVPFEFFHENALRVFPGINHGNAPEMGNANYLYEWEDITIRYCRYLCPFGLCYVTGTRIGPDGSVFICMKQWGRFYIKSWESLEDSMRTIMKAIKFGCGTGPAGNKDYDQ